MYDYIYIIIYNHMINYIFKLIAANHLLPSLLHLIQSELHLIEDVHDSSHLLILLFCSWCAHAHPCQIST